MLKGPGAHPKKKKRGQSAVKKRKEVKDVILEDNGAGFDSPLF